MFTFCFRSDVQISREKTRVDSEKKFIYKIPSDIHICKGVQGYFFFFFVISQHVYKFKEEKIRGTWDFLYLFFTFVLHIFRQNPMLSQFTFLFRF